ncbi:hypothetical protein OPV22_000198 [Ensete ventricosum]|uniref:eRF1/Pelota-like N-terminal domain-containing protein n=1 Tax=Ensete ventricosum TaxID=4639 RepID=A0AAV8RIE9_ENSVE|nr:hypothetical protein OPV22_000198 [Ensete ventricosum]
MERAISLSSSSWAYGKKSLKLGPPPYSNTISVRPSCGRPLAMPLGTHSVQSQTPREKETFGFGLLGRYRLPSRRRPGFRRLFRHKLAEMAETDKNIEIWKVKKLIRALEAARGAITSAQQRLKLYNKVPPNGLVLYTGTIVTEDGKEKKVTIDFEPFKPINASLYLCDNKFHTEALNELLESDDKFGFIVMDGNGTLFGTLSGNTREVLHKFTVDLPKKHGRGGQSALRFARLRMEKRHNYVRKTAELATQFFINPATSQPNVAGLILAGSADFKTELSQSDMFDQRLQAKILNVVDVSYGGENGFNQAIELSAEILSNVKFIQEKKLIGKYFEEISQDTGKYVFGVEDTLKALEMGAVETLIVWENLDINRYVLKHSTSGETVIKHLRKDQETDQNNFLDSATSAELEVQEKISLLEWFANEYKRFGCTLEFVTNKSQEGSQFCRGFGGIGGILPNQLLDSVQREPVLAPLPVTELALLNCTHLKKLREGSRTTD